ncbi:GNAT family N-acetyltransferase [Hymenobacter latericus]|uniref:GNAT family N-acetyltransferase n=1 Tax=Hymenobacter sp. YIM 151858-1 TaxID=2987688 RepID=UPI0022265046|nr:GNAT family N-acetyltransferase [Hymenobacter sp. YIM 151858-1]UYZ60817.1 GNAT family N-acetyltransferase [Hymenobacter sp. YIM 151858-1]
MNFAYTVAAATAADVPALVQLINSAYRSEPAQAGWTGEGHLLSGPRTDDAALHELLQTPAATILTYHDAAHQLRGCVFVQPQQGTLYLGLLAVQPHAQAQGIGKQLLRAAEAHARQHACRSITITVLSARPELMAWYERHGFRASGETQPFPADARFGVPAQPLTLVEMLKVLP